MQGQRYDGGDEEVVTGPAGGAAAGACIHRTLVATDKSSGSRVPNIASASGSTLRASFRSLGNSIDHPEARSVSFLCQLWIISEWGGKKTNLFMNGIFLWVLSFLLFRSKLM